MTIPPFIFDFCALAAMFFFGLYVGAALTAPANVNEAAARMRGRR